MKPVPSRRTDNERRQVGGLYDGIMRYYDQNMETTVVKLMTGDCYSTGEEREMLVTILGSCISVCAWDHVAKCGGMNHILLPGTGNVQKHHDKGYANRFGAFAMEELMNGLYKLGATRESIRVKLFGGGNVIKNSSMIGDKNIKFVREFLNEEGYKVVAENVGGKHPRRIHFFPDTGKVMMRMLKRKDDYQIIEIENTYKKSLEDKEEKTEVDIF
jgi:chemotaxis protein CheD